MKASIYETLIIWYWHFLVAALILVSPFHCTKNPISSLFPLWKRKGVHWANWFWCYKGVWKTRDYLFQLVNNKPKPWEKNGRIIPFEFTLRTVKNNYWNPFLWLFHIYNHSQSFLQFLQLYSVTCFFFDPSYLYKNSLTSRRSGTWNPSSWLQ